MEYCTSKISKLHGSNPSRLVHLTCTIYYVWHKKWMCHVIFDWHWIVQVTLYPCPMSIESVEAQMLRRSGENWPQKWMITQPIMWRLDRHLVHWLAFGTCSDNFILPGTVNPTVPTTSFLHIKEEKKSMSTDIHQYPGSRAYEYHLLSYHTPMKL